MKLIVRTSEEIEIELTDSELFEYARKVEEKGFILTNISYHVSDPNIKTMDFTKL